MNQPRRPTFFELADLTRLFLKDDRKRKWEDVSATEHISNTLIAVFDRYYCPFPTYSGRVMVVLWGLQTSRLELYVWDDTELLSLDDYRRRKNM